MELFDITSLIAFLTLGAFGSPHCIGMCGGFAIRAIAPAPDDQVSASRRAVAFTVGKTASYLVAGTSLIALLSILGFTPAAEGRWAAGLQVAVGAFCLGAGAQMLLGLRVRTQLGQLLLSPFSKLYALVRSIEGTGAAFGTGLLVGLLPCGMSWSAFALATQTSVPTAMVGLLLFGLSAGPLLSLSAWGAVAHGRLSRVHLQRFAGLLILILGARTTFRGASAWIGEAPAPCHDSGDTTTSSNHSP